MPGTDAQALDIVASYPIKITTTAVTITVSQATRSVLLTTTAGSLDPSTDPPTAVQWAWDADPTAFSSFGTTDDPAAGDAAILAGAAVVLRRPASASALHLICNQGEVGALVSVVRRMGSD